MEKIQMINLDEGLTLTDAYSDEVFTTKNGVGFLLGGLPVSANRALREGFIIGKDFQGPTFKRRTEVSNWLTDTIKIPRGTQCYVDVYKHFADRLPKDAF